MAHALLLLRITERYCADLVRRCPGSRLTLYLIHSLLFMSTRPVLGLVVFLCASSALTAQKRVEEMLRESKEHFRSLFENASLGYQSLDETGNFIEVNETWCNLLGCAKAEV